MKQFNKWRRAQWWNHWNGGGSTKEETYEYEHPSERDNDPSKDIIKNQDQNYQGDATIENDGPEKMIEDEDMDQPGEIETDQEER